MGGLLKFLGSGNDGIITRNIRATKRGREDDTSSEDGLLDGTSGVMAMGV